MADRDHIVSVCERYVELLTAQDHEGIVALFADDATVEDPVGGEVHIGRHAIAGFYKNIEGAPKETDLLTLRVAGHEAAFVFAITVGAGEHRIRIEPIDVMVFDSEGKIASMKSYWSPANVTPV